MHPSYWLVLTATLLCSPLYAADTGTVLKADQLRADTFNDAKVVGTVNKNDTVSILAKKGAWLQIQSGKHTGWVRLLTVKRQSSSGNTLAGAVNVATGRSGTGNVVSTTGIRGLSADDLKTAAFNESEIRTLENASVSAESAKQFATAGGLSARSLPYFAAPGARQ